MHGKWNEHGNPNQMAWKDNENEMETKWNKIRWKGNSLKQIEWTDLAYQEMEWVETQGHEMRMQIELRM